MAEKRLGTTGLEVVVSFTISVDNSLYLNYLLKH